MPVVFSDRLFPPQDLIQDTLLNQPALRLVSQIFGVQISKTLD